MKRWVGRWIMGVGLIHLPVALFVHRIAWGEIAQAGWFDAVRGHVHRGHAAWFLLAGLLLLMLGGVVDAMEKARMRPGRHLGWLMLAAAAFLLVLIPLSGTWLLLPPAFALALNGGADRGTAVP